MTEEKKNGSEDSNGDSGFELGAPAGRIPDEDKSPLDVKEPAYTDHDPRRLAEKQRMGGEWRGFETEEEQEPPIHFRQRERDEDDLDMTPMVDVTFLLLIFFMVTASFTMQKSIQQPPVSTEEPSTAVIEQPEDEDEYVEIIIDQFNTYRLTSRAEEEIEAPSDQEMRVRLRDMVNSFNAKKVIITAHGEATNEKVVTAWDAANDNEVQEIVIRLSETDF